MKSLVHVLAHFLFFRQKFVVKAKVAKVVYLQLPINMTENVYDSHHGSVYLNGTFLQLCFFVITNKFARISLNIFGDTLFQSLKSGKQEKLASLPWRGRKS